MTTIWYLDLFKIQFFLLDIWLTRHWEHIDNKTLMTNNLNFFLPVYEKKINMWDNNLKIQKNLVVYGIEKVVSICKR